MVSMTCPKKLLWYHLKLDPFKVARLRFVWGPTLEDSAAAVNWRARIIC